MAGYTLFPYAFLKMVTFHPGGHSRNAPIGCVIKGLRYYNTAAPLNALPMNASGACNVRVETTGRSIREVPINECEYSV